MSDVCNVVVFLMFSISLGVSFRANVTYSNKVLFYTEIGAKSIFGNI